MEKVIMPKGTITLPMLMATAPKMIFMMVNFLVVKVPPAYNAILERLFLRMSQAMVSTYHLMVKFPTDQGVSELSSD